MEPRHSLQRTTRTALVKPWAAIPSVLLTFALTVRAQTALSDWRTGIATHYGGSQDGMDPYSPSFGTSVGGCGYGVLDKDEYPFWSVAALSTSNVFFKKGPVNGCGECFQVECINDGPQFAGRCNSDPSQRSVTVMITDACPECGADHMDIQALTFNKMAPMAIGRIAMRYRQVECSPPGSLKVTIDKNYGTDRWLRLMVEIYSMCACRLRAVLNYGRCTAGYDISCNPGNVASVGAIKTVQIKGKNSDWQGMNNYWGAAWELSNAPQPPLDIRILDSAGKEVTAFGAIKADGQIGTLPLGVQFSFSNEASGADFAQSGSGASAASSSSSSGEQASATVTAFSGPEDGSSSSGPSASSSDPIPCITAFQGTTVNPKNCATESGSAASGSSSPSPSNNTSSSSTNSSSGAQPPPPNSSYSSPPPPGSSGNNAQNTLRGNGASWQPSSPGTPSWGSSTQSPPPPPPSWSSASPPPSPGSSASSGNSCSCDDQQPPGGYSCSQQKAWGACSQGWMWQYAPDRPKGYCASTCGYCKC